MSPRRRPYELEGFEFCYRTTQDDSESQIAIRKGYSNCGFPENMWTTHQTRRIARHLPPHPKKNWKFRQNRKNPGFFLQTHDLLEKPGIFPQVTGKPGVCIRTREISRVQKVRVYIYMKKPFEKKTANQKLHGYKKKGDSQVTVDEPKWSGCHPIKVCRNKKYIKRRTGKILLQLKQINSSDISAANPKKNTTFHWKSHSVDIKIKPKTLNVWHVDLHLAIAYGI